MSSLQRLTEESPRLRESLPEFVRASWHIVEPGAPLVTNWHIDAICQHLQAVSEGRIRNLLITIPPGHMKSLLVSVFWPVWTWLKNPAWRAIFSSYADALVVRDSIRRRDILESFWFNETFRPVWRLADDQNAKDHYKNTEGGFHVTTTVGGKATGLRGDCVVVDDPINISEANSEAVRHKVIHWWDKVMPTRLNDPRVGARIIMMQRVHEEDLAGHVLERGGYQHLCLPTEFEVERRCRTAIGWRDPRGQEGELLFPEMFPPSVITELKRDLGSDGFAGQHQQRPAPAEGSMFKRSWWRYWRKPIAEARPGSTAKLLPERFDEVIQSWDMAFKGTDGSDYVVGLVIGRVGADKYVLYRTRERLAFTDTLREFKRVTALYPKARRKLVEDKANGTAVIDSLKSSIPGIVAVTPMGGKEARAAAISPDVEAGNVYLPEDAEWLTEFIDELASFPKGRHDDQVDALSQGLTYFIEDEGTARTRRLVSM